MAKYITNVLILTSIFISFLMILLGHLNSMYVGGFLKNFEQHANIDHNNDVDNHVNLATA
jgi:hypothetical protein